MASSWFCLFYLFSLCLKLNESSEIDKSGTTHNFITFSSLNTSFADLHALHAAKSQADKLANLIYQRFEFHNKDWFQFFMGSSNMPDYAWDILKYKVAKKFVDGNSTFLFIFGGSSVTAGHDNYYNQSYPLVLERRLKPVFDALGISLLVHNIAQGLTILF